MLDMLCLLSPPPLTLSRTPALSYSHAVTGQISLSSIRHISPSSISSIIHTSSLLLIPPPNTAAYVEADYFPLFEAFLPVLIQESGRYFGIKKQHAHSASKNGLFPRFFMAFFNKKRPQGITSSRSSSIFFLLFFPHFKMEIIFANKMEMRFAKQHVAYSNSLCPRSHLTYFV